MGDSVRRGVGDLVGEVVGALVGLAWALVAASLRALVSIPLRGEGGEDPAAAVEVRHSGSGYVAAPML